MGREAVRLLEHFDRPQCVDRVCAALAEQEAAAERWRALKELRLAADKLVSLGFLLPAPAEPGAVGGGALEEPFTSLEDFDFHLRMLADQARVDAYREAIARVVRPGQHVVEIGTGSGIMAVLAARAGARVTAIERYAVVDLARAVALASGVADRITFVRGRADQVELPAPGDVLISELVGNRILNEGLLETTLDARQRLLRPDAALLPRRVEIWAQLVHTDRFARLDPLLERVSQRHGVSLQPMGGWFARRLGAGQVVWEMEPGEAGVTFLSPPGRVISLDLRRLTQAAFAATACLRPAAPAAPGVRVNAVALSFRLVLLPGLELSTNRPAHGLHWSRPVFMLPAPLPVRREGYTVRLSYERHAEVTVEVSR